MNSPHLSRNRPARASFRPTPRALILAATLGLLALACSAMPSRPSHPPGKPSRVVIVSHSSPGPGSSPRTAWEAPELTDPITITIGNEDRNLVLDRTRDYILRCPPGPVRLSGKLSVWGGRNVVLEECNEQVTRPDWAGYFEDQARTLWIDDVHFGGPHLTGGIQLQEPGATVVMRDVLFDTVHGSYTTNHAELVQTWAGPARLLVDGLTGSDTYQGLFLLPNQHYNGPSPTIFDLRHVDIDNSHGGYALWLSDQHGRFRCNVEDVYVLPNRAKLWRGWWLWGFRGEEATTGARQTWGDVLPGRPPGGPYVHATADGATGVDQTSDPAPLPGEQS